MLILTRIQDVLKVSNGQFCRNMHLPVKVTVGDAEETQHSTDNEELRDTEDPAGEGQGGPVHVPEVPDDD